MSTEKISSDPNYVHEVKDVQVPGSFNGFNKNNLSSRNGRKPVV
jgi:hypothetical protein